ncbi:hypothetical protein NDU88_001281, partial [Pleurodeles waltl]
VGSTVAWPANGEKGHIMQSHVYKEQRQTKALLACGSKAHIMECAAFQATRDNHGRNNTGKGEGGRLP